MMGPNPGAPSQAILNVSFTIQRFKRFPFNYCASIISIVSQAKMGLIGCRLIVDSDHTACMNPQKCLSSNVRKFRENKRWSQEKLAEISGLHRTYVSGIERGVRNPTLTVLNQLAIALEVNISDLLSV